jgi:hypothetical protein
VRPSNVNRIHRVDPARSQSASGAASQFRHFCIKIPGFKCSVTAAATRNPSGEHSHPLTIRSCPLTFVRTQDFCVPGLEQQKKPPDAQLW